MNVEVEHRTGQEPGWRHAREAPGFKWQGQFDVGFTYALADAIQLDFGCNFGVTKSALDYQPFVGRSRRF